MSIVLPRRRILTTGMAWARQDDGLMHRTLPAKGEWSGRLTTADTKVIVVGEAAAAAAEAEAVGAGAGVGVGDVAEAEPPPSANLTGMGLTSGDG